MDRRLQYAYDKMTMPEGCSQRIEKLLLEGAKPRKQRQNQVILQSKTGWRAWSSAAALVCLAVAISLGGVFLFVETQKQRDMIQFRQPTQAETGTQTNTEMGEVFSLSEKGKEFLLAMCYAMPDWENYYVLDDQFWEDFLYASFTCPEEVTENKARTIIGEVPLENGTVLISREQAESYASLAMGCDLPVLDLDKGKDGMGIRYDDGYYRIQMSNFGSRGFKLHKWVSDSEESCDVMFHIYVDEEDNVIGSVRFKLRKADNENGFLIVGKQSELTLPEEAMRQIEKQDVLADLSGEEGEFRQSVRETDFYTAYQYHIPWNGDMVSAQTCFSGGTITYSGGTGEVLSIDPIRMHRLEEGSWQEVEMDTMTLTARKDGKPTTVTLLYGEDEKGKRHPAGDFYYTNQGKWLEVRTGSRWWIAGEQAAPGTYSDGLWRLDPVKEEMVDFWGAVPEDNRVNAIYDFISGVDIFEDGSFLSAYLNEDRERCFLYANTVKGAVYNLETLVGRDLDDCVGLPNEKEILCWSGGEYWRIPRDTMRPEYMGTLQENVVFASGVFGGDRALFSIGQVPGKTGSYRIYDYVENRFLTLSNCDLGLENVSTRVSPDGRKLLIIGSRSMIEALHGEDIPIQVLNCENGTLLTIRRAGWDGSGNVQWLLGGEISIDIYDENSCVYTLK